MALKTIASFYPKRERERGMEKRERERGRGDRERERGRKRELEGE